MGGLTISLNEIDAIIAKLLIGLQKLSPQQAIILGAIATLTRSHKAVDEVLVAQLLDKQGVIESVGGLEHIDSLIDQFDPGDS